MQYTENTTSSQEPDIIPVKQALFSGATIAFGKIISFIASFAAITVLGNVVPREIAGTYNYIIAVFTIISITTLPGMNNALARSVAKGFDGNLTIIVRKRFLFGTLGIALSCIIAIVMFIVGNKDLGFAFLVVAPFVPLTDTLSNLTTSFWQGKKQFHKSALWGAVYYLLFGTANILIYLTTSNIYLLLFGVLTGQALAGWFVFSRIKQENMTTDNASVRLGYHLSLMQGFKILAGNIDRVIVWFIAGPVSVAAYSFAITPLNRGSQLIPIGAVSLPHFSNHQFTKNIKKVILKKVGLLFLIMIPIAITGVILAPFIYGILFPKYPESVMYFQILVMTLAFAPIAMIDSAMTAFHKTRQLYITEIGSPIIKVLLMIILGIYFGMIGIVSSLVITSFLDALITLTLFITAKIESD
jgi:O-antigen/teichoic acid export membrane protein